MENLDDIDTKIMIKERWITIKNLWKNLEEFQINKLETKTKAEIEILKEEENKIRNAIDCFKKSRPQLLNLYVKENRDIDNCKKLGYKYEKYISVKGLGKLENKN